MLMLSKFNDKYTGIRYIILFTLYMLETSLTKKLPQTIAKFSVFVRSTKIQMSGWFEARLLNIRAQYKKANQIVWFFCLFVFSF